MSPPCDPARGGASLCLRWPGLPRAPVPCKTLDTVLPAGRQESEPSAMSPASGVPGQERAATCSFPRGRSPPRLAPRHPGTTALAAEGGQGPSPREALTAREHVHWGPGGVPSTAAPLSWHREYYEPCIYLSHVQR